MIVNTITGSISGSITGPIISTPWLSGAPAGAVLAFDALTPDDTTFEMLGVHTGVGSLSTTKTSDHYGIDHEDVYRLSETNEETWSGGRAAKNEMYPSADFTDVRWLLASGCVKEGVASGVGPSGEDAMEVSFSASTSEMYQSLVAGPRHMVASFLVRSVSGTTAVRIRSNALDSDIAVGETWIRITSDFAAGEKKTGLFNRASGITGNLYVVYGQAEESTGRTDTATPSEYIATTSAPITKTFGNSNGNSVSSGICTEAAGSALAEVPYLQYYPASTNDQIHSNDLTNAEWTATTMTVAQDVVGITGAPNTGCTLTATGANSTVIANAITQASDDQATCWFIKRKTGTGNVDLTLDNGSTWTTITLTTSYQKFTVDQAALTNPQIGIRLVADTDAVIVGNAECYLTKTEEETRGLGVIFTVASAVSVDAVLGNWDDANHSDTEGGYYLEWKPSASTAEMSGDIQILSLNNAAGLLYYDATNSLLKSTDGTNTASASLTVVAGTTYKLGLAYDASNLNVGVDSSWGTSQSYDGGFTAGTEMDHMLSVGFAMQDRELKRYDGSYLLAKAEIDTLMSA